MNHFARALITLLRVVFGLGRGLTSLIVLLCIAATPALAKTYSDNGDGTVTDPTTGLMWMRCSMGQTWTGSECSGFAYYDTWDYAASITAYPFAGHSDWRSPNIRELTTIVDWSRYKPSIDSTAFPNTPPASFWSTSSGGLSSGYALRVIFSNGSTGDAANNNVFDIRLVRSEQTSALLNLARPTSDYVDNGDGTATHTPTDLMWKRCVEGQNWSGTTCTGTASTFTWEEAVAAKDSFAEQTDWRLPNIEELLTLVDYTGLAPPINTTVFPGADASAFWTDSADVSVSNKAWVTNFSLGYALSFAKSSTMKVRLVRTILRPLTVAKTGTGTVNTTPAGIDCGSTCTAKFASGAEVALTAVPAAGSSFTSWGGACSGSTATCTVTMSAAQDVIANFTDFPLVSESATSRAFANTNVGSVSAAQTVTLSNTGTASLTIVSITASGDFSQTNNCGAIVTAGAACALTITFTPTTSGERLGAVTVTSNASGSPHRIALSGTGAALSGIAIIGAASVNEGASGAYAVTATYDNGSTATVAATFSLSGTAATLTGSQLSGATVTSDQTVMLNAAYTEFGVTKTATLSVTIRNSVNVLTGLAITGSASVNETSSGNYFLTATYDNGGAATVTGMLTLTGAAATLTGLRLAAATVTADQTVTLNGSYTESGVTKTASLLVTIKNSVNILTAIAITGAASINEASSATYNIAATYDNGSTATVPGSLTIVGSAATLSGNTLNAVLAVPSDQAVTLNASYSEGGVNKTASLIVIIKVKDIASVPVSFDLVQGWNLLGNGIEQAVSVASLFGDPLAVTSVWKWDATSSGWQFYTPSLGASALHAYATSKGYGVLSVINPGEGFWVNANQFFTKPFPSGISIAAISFQEGKPGALMQAWSLISIGIPRTPSGFNADISASPPAAGVIPLNITSIWAWDSALGKWYFYAPSLEAQGGTSLTDYITSKGYLDFTANKKTLGPGVGFWVNKP